MTNGTGRRRKPAARIPRRAQGEDCVTRDARLAAAVREHGDEDALEALVSEYLGLVRRIARRFAVPDDEVDDLVQEGVVGLLKAARRFDPGRGVSFQAYASALVTGEIRHHLRDRSSVVRLPEPVQDLRSRLRSLVAGERAERGREPTTAELASLAEVSDEQVVEALTAGAAPLESDVPAPDLESGRSEERVELEARLGKLEPREREVVYYRFFADLTQAEIGERVGVSQMHVSRLLHSALEKLRAESGGR
jgi:RNA polymerase sigma-B factor